MTLTFNAMNAVRAPKFTNLVMVSRAKMRTTASVTTPTKTVALKAYDTWDGLWRGTRRPEASRRGSPSRGCARWPAGPRARWLCRRHRHGLPGRHARGLPRGRLPPRWRVGPEPRRRLHPPEHPRRRGRRPGL